MIRRNIMNALLVLLAAGALLTVYNAFLNSNSSDENNASTKLANYLNLDRATQEVEGAEDVIAGTEQTDTTTEQAPTEQTESTPTPPAEEPAPATEVEQPAEEPAQTTPAPATPGTDKAQSVYTVKQGDTYACIAEKYYGSYEHYVDVMAANPVNQLGFTEYGLHVGAQIVLPAISGANLKPASSRCA